MNGLRSFEDYLDHWGSYINLRHKLDSFARYCYTQKLFYTPFARESIYLLLNNDEEIKTNICFHSIRILSQRTDFLVLLFLNGYAGFMLESVQTISVINLSYFL